MDSPMIPQHLTINVDNQNYMVQMATNGEGLYFAPCNIIAGFGYYEPSRVRYIPISKPVYFVRDEGLIRKLIRLHIRITQPIETYSSASDN